MKTILFGLLAMAALLQSCTLGRSFRYNAASIRDYKIFASRPLYASDKPFRFINASGKGILTDSISYGGHVQHLDKFMEDHNTVAFLVIRNDSMLYEKYYNHYNRESYVASFSMAKSFTSALIGAAIADGFIKSVKDPVTDYIPELLGKGFEAVTLEHILKMTSGLKFKESYWSPFGKAAVYYYTEDLRKQIGKLKLKHYPGTTFDYKSGNTQLLGLVLERATHKTVTQYMQEKVWEPIGMEYDANWSLDRKDTGLEKTFCCLNARALDFAKFGRLYLNKGNWNGKQVLPAAYITESVKVDTTVGSVPYYQYQWWLPNPGDGSFCAVGILGQYIFVDPSQNLIIVRLGKNQGGVNWLKVLQAYKLT
ncbi:serine hydrolase [soil metagenome]